MQDCGGDGIGSHGEPTNCVGFPCTKALFLEHVEHDVADQGCGLVVEGCPPHVDVVVGDNAGGEGDFTLDDGKVANKLDEALALRIVRFHGASLLASGPSRARGLANQPARHGSYDTGRPLIQR